MVFFQKMKLVKEKFTPHNYYIVHDFEINSTYYRDELIYFINLNFYKNLNTENIEIEPDFEEIYLISADVEPSIKNKNYFYSLYKTKNNIYYLRYNNLYDGILYKAEPTTKKELLKRFHFSNT